MRVIDPAAPSPLVSLMSDVEGATAYARGQNSDPRRWVCMRTARR